MQRSTPVLVSETVVEERIQQAMRRGDFDNLPGAGKPLDLAEDPLVPPEVRVAYRMLKNAGCVPPEILERREMAALEAASTGAPDLEERKRAIAKLAVMRMKLGGGRGRALTRNAYYERKIVEKLGGL